MFENCGHGCIEKNTYTKCLHKIKFYLKDVISSPYYTGRVCDLTNSTNLHKKGELKMLISKNLLLIKKSSLQSTKERSIIMQEK